MLKTSMFFMFGCKMGISTEATVIGMLVFLCFTLYTLAWPVNGIKHVYGMLFSISVMNMIGGEMQDIVAFQCKQLSAQATIEGRYMLPVEVHPNLISLRLRI